MLKTERLSLRFVKAEDIEAIHKLLSLPETDQFNTMGIPASSDETYVFVKQWLEEAKPIKRNKFTYVIEDGENQIIGLIALNLSQEKYSRGEVWYKLLPDFWKRGFATEALKGILKFGFNNLKLHRIEAGCAVDNIGSVKVLEKAGMIREGRKRQVLPLKTGWSDGYDYAILAEDFQG
ncbi:MAG: GNAT family N-acetyltransferase [Leeuwenhoekiella sp.]